MFGSLACFLRHVCSFSAQIGEQTNDPCLHSHTSHEFFGFVTTWFGGMIISLVPFLTIQCSWGVVVVVDKGVDVVEKPRWIC